MFESANGAQPARLADIIALQEHYAGNQTRPRWRTVIRQ